VQQLFTQISELCEDKQALVCVLIDEVNIFDLLVV
jgi:hypothetical protein